MSFREEDRRKNSSTSRGLGLAAAAIGVGVGAALYYIFSKRQEQPDSEGATSENWTTEEPQTFARTATSTPSRTPSFIQFFSPISEYTTISEHTTTDTSVHDSEIEADRKSSRMYSNNWINSLRSIVTSEDNVNNGRRNPRRRLLIRPYYESHCNSSSSYGNRVNSGDSSTSGPSDEDNVTESEKDSESEDEDPYSNDSNTSSPDVDSNESVEDPDSNDSNTSSTGVDSNESVEDPDSNTSSAGGELNESEESNNSLVLLDSSISLPDNRNDTLNSGYESDHELNEWDVTSSSRDVPTTQAERSLLRYLAELSDNIASIFRSDDARIRDPEEERSRIQREQTFRDRKWSLEECAICFDVMLRDQQLLALPCTHNFHVSCIGPWLQERHTCPVCRKPA